MEKDANTSSEIPKEELKPKKTNTATDILSYQAEQNKKLFVLLLVCNIAWAIATIAIVGCMFHRVIGFLEQYDFNSSVEQTGLYTFSDSEGNVISSDITPQEMERILKILNGKDGNQAIYDKEGRQSEENSQ